MNLCRETTAFINPTDCIKPLSEFPEICITTFSQNIITEFIKNNNTKIIANLYSANGILPVYEIKYNDVSVGVFLSRVGAPACVVGLEEIIALGAKKIIQFGSCGILNQSATENKIIIPTSAIRDEGTSYHYIEKGDEIAAEYFINKYCNAVFGKTQYSVYPRKNLDNRWHLPRNFKSY